MKVLKIIVSIIAFCLLAYYLYQVIAKPNGKKYECDKNHTVYYKGNTTEDDAKKVCSYFKEIGYLVDSNEASIQISTTEKSKDTMMMRFIVDKSKIDAESEAAFLTLGGAFSMKSLNSKPVVVILADKYMDDFKNLGYAKPVY